MARAKKKAAGRRSQRKSTSGKSDAITVLKADHRQVETWFEQFESTRSAQRKASLAQQICQALKVHTQAEAEIFYPAFLEATGDTDIHHEAEVEHDSAKELIEKIEAGGSEDEYFDARVTVLAEMIKHHVKEEEQPGGMFAKARSARMELQELGQQLIERKRQLMNGQKTTIARVAARRA